MVEISCVVSEESLNLVSAISRYFPSGLLGVDTTTLYVMFAVYITFEFNSLSAISFMVIRGWLNNSSIMGEAITEFIFLHILFFQLYCISIKDFEHFMTFRELTVDQLEELLTNIRFQNL